VAPLLQSLSRRALLAGQGPGVMDAILPHLKTGTPAIREVAARTLAAIFASDPSGQGPYRAVAVKALVAALETGGPDLAARVALIDAVGAAGKMAGLDQVAVTWLKEDPRSATLAETAARLRALGKLAVVDQKEQVARIYGAMPLDLPADVQQEAGHALLRLDAKGAAGLISSRLANKQAAGLGFALEIDMLGRLPPELATPELLKAWGKALGPQESFGFAVACARVADPRLITAVSTLLDPRQGQVRAFAALALRRIDNDEAASALWPHLDEEIDLSSKLQLISFLGRHGFRDGYAQVIEHLSDAALSDQAVLALGRSASRERFPSCGASGRPATTWRGIRRRYVRWRGWARRTSLPGCWSSPACRVTRLPLQRWSAWATSDRPRRYRSCATRSVREAMCS
jgi:hypothetical protein